MSLKLMSVVIPASLTGQRIIKPEDSDLLLKQLLESVQNCQKRFGGKTELATEFDSCVIALCVTLERVLSHGLRTKPLETVQTSTLKQVSGIVVNSLQKSNECTFWPFLKNNLIKHEQERYSVLKNINTDLGKSRAWIRASLNERSLERYFHTLLGSEDSLKVYYEDRALLRDQEKNSLLPNMAAGLGSILFAISIDKAELNSPSITQNHSNSIKSEPVIEAPVPDQTNKHSKEKRKKKVARQFISFDEDSLLSSSIPSSSGSVSSESNSLTDIIGNSATYNSNTTNNNGDNSSKNRSKTRSSDNHNKTKTMNETEENETFSDRRNPATLTPVGRHSTLEMVGELTPVSIETRDDDDDVDDDEDSRSRAIESASDVSAVLGAVESKNEEERKRLTDKMEFLRKENETLKEQVGKYLSALKMLGKGDDEEIDPILPDYKSEAKIFERKLVQVAEMHAELMDFNVHLQQSICEKDALVDRLKTELELLRGPLSLDDNNLEESMGNVHVWIPSAFLTGPSSNSHHVYQIFLRAGNDEWNIYRRYAQFHSLHTDLKKLDPAVSSFDFPPKKSLGKRDASLVEDRRKRLQTYLRRVLAHWPELAHCSSRILLEQHLAFFKKESIESP